MVLSSPIHIGVEYCSVMVDCAIMLSRLDVLHVSNILGISEEKNSKLCKKKTLQKGVRFNARCLPLVFEKKESEPFPYRLY